MKLSRPGCAMSDRVIVLASTPNFERRQEAARPGSLSLVLDLSAERLLLGMSMMGTLCKKRNMEFLTFIQEPNSR
jgi:hypothetical protein